MQPILFYIFGLPIASWYLFYVLANLTGYFVFLNNLRHAKHKQALDIEDGAPYFFIICYICGWFGARGLSIVVEQFEVSTLTQFIVALFQIGPLTFFGGILGGFFGAAAFISIKKWQFSFIGDAALPGVIAALGVGRIGCFLNGDDYGRAVSTRPPPWWSVKFPNLADGIYRYPVQLEESIFSLIAAAIFVWWFRKMYSHDGARPQGLIACGCVLVLSVHRFFNEIYRGDLRGYFLSTRFSTSQGIAAILVVICLFLVVKTVNKYNSLKYK